MPSEANTKRAEPSEWAKLESERWHYRHDNPVAVLAGLTPAPARESLRSLALALDAAEQRGRESVEAELRRLRERIELMATHHEKSVTAYVAVQPRGEHRAIGKAFRELLAEHDAGGGK